MAQEALSPLPSDIKLENWLHEWGQQLAHDHSQVKNGQEKPATCYLDNANSLFWLTSLNIDQQTRATLHENGANIELLQSGHPLKKLISALRARQEGYYPTEIAAKKLDENIIHHAQDYFSAQLACSPEKSSTAKFIQQAWDSYCDMLEISHSTLLPQAEISKAADKVRKIMSEQGDPELYTKLADAVIEQNLQCLGNAVGIDIDTCYRNPKMPGEIIMEVLSYGESPTKHHRKTKQNEHKLYHFLHALCQELNTEILGDVRLFENDRVGFTPACDFDALIQMDGRSLEKTAQTIDQSLIEQVTLSHQVTVPEKEKKPVAMEELINAAFLGARMGVPESIIKQSNAVAITLNKIMPKNQRRLDAAIAALHDAGIQCEHTGNTQNGDVIGLKINKVSNLLMNITTPETVIASAREHLQKRMTQDLPGARSATHRAR